ncbi:MAG TPA: phytanoyl-CoA dioxygenase family protein [Allosphingosinicella sp.]|jgi:ectoine hydroxylase-related dioxygenase (phytanoyl-CoA dioxygenase family)
MTSHASDRDYVAAYRRNGFVILRGIFAADEVAAIGAAAEQVHDEGLRLGRSFRHGNLFYRIGQNAGGVGEGAGAVVQMVQWPSYHQAGLNAVRLDRRFASILAPLIGGDLKQIINQIHWKARGSAGDFAWHQDSRFRKPERAYRNLGDAYVQTGLALDPHTPEAGCLRFVPGSHLWGTLPLEEPEDVLGTAMRDQALEAVGLRAADAVDVVMEPGDLALWSPYLVHGSGTNRAAHRRRLYINGYVRAEDCDRGEWAFRGGRPVPLGPEPALVHYEALRERGEPHFV